MRFGERVREIRIERNLTQQKLAEKVGVTVGYISKIETNRLQFGDYLSDKFVHKRADALQCEEDELLLLADRVPPAIRNRVLERPDLFPVVAEMNDQEMDKFLEQFGKKR